MGFKLFEKISDEKRPESEEQNEGVSMAPLGGTADPIGPIQSKPRGQTFRSFDTHLTNDVYDPGDVGLRDSPLLKRMIVNLIPSPSPPPAAPLPQVSSDSSPAVVAIRKGKKPKTDEFVSITQGGPYLFRTYEPDQIINTIAGSPGRKGSNRPKNRPSQGDAVLVSFMDGGKRPEIARQAGAQPLASDNEEEEQPLEGEDSIPPLALSTVFSAEEIEEFERLNLNKQKEVKIEYLNHAVPLSPSYELWLEERKRQQNEGSSMPSLSGFQDTTQEDAHRQHPETSYDKTGMQINRAPSLSPRLGAPPNDAGRRIKTKGHQLTPRRYWVWRCDYCWGLSNLNADIVTHCPDCNHPRCKACPVEEREIRNYRSLGGEAPISRNEEAPTSGNEEAPSSKKKDVQPTLDVEANPTSPGLLYIDSTAKWEAVTFKHCQQGETFVSSNIVSKFQLKPLDGRVRLVWNLSGGATTYETEFIVRDGLNNDFTLGPEIVDGQFNLPSHTGPSQVHQSPGFGLEHTKLEVAFPDDSSEGSADTGSVSWISEGESSQTSISETLGAPEEFADLLLHSEGLRPLFSKGCEELDGSVFKREFKSLLKSFSIDLTKEAGKATEIAAAQLVRKSRRRVTLNIWKKIYGINLGESLASALDQTKLSKAKKLEEALRRLNSPPTNDVQISELQVDNDSSDDEDAYDKLENLKQVKRFLIDSHAFTAFQQQFELLLGSENQEEDDIAKTGDTNAAMAVEYSNGLFTAFRMAVIEGVRCFSQRALEGASRIVASIKADNQRMSLARRWQGIHNLIERQFRPAIPPGYRRIEWLCGCGATLYGDFDDSDPRQVDELQRELLEEDNQANQEQEGYNEHNPGGTSCASLHLPSNTAPLSSRAPARNLPGSNTFTTSNTGAQTGSYIPLPTFSSSPFSSPTPKYFALCVNNGEYLTIVVEIEVSSITWDGEFFRKMWEEYYTLRGFRSRYFRHLLVKPVDVRYVKFIVDHGTYRQQAVILPDPPDFPDKREVDEGRYEYTPCPLRTRPPAAVFLHYRNSTKCFPNRSYTRWFSRIPKKLSPAVLHASQNAQPNEDVIGWGVHIIEGPNKKAITWLCLLLLCLSFTVSVLYTRLRHDASSGFAIGAFLLTAGTLLMPAFYFQWKEE